MMVPPPTGSPAMPSVAASDAASDADNLPQTLYGVRWDGGLEDGHLVLLDQTRLPKELVYLQIRDIEALRTAICDLAVRGAPAIGIAGAFGVVLHLVPLARGRFAGKGSEVMRPELERACERLVSSRPTAVNLKWAIGRMRDCFDRHEGDLAALEMCARLLMEAKRILREDLELCRRIADNGAALLPASG